MIEDEDENNKENRNEFFIFFGPATQLKHPSEYSDPNRMRGTVFETLNNLQKT